MPERETPRAKFERIIHRERTTQRLLQQLPPETSHRYLVMELPLNKLRYLLSKKDELLGRSHPSVTDVVHVRRYDPEKYPEDPQTFADLFNLVLMTSPDPYRPLTVEEAFTYFKQGTFLAFLYGKPAGYGVVTIEDTPEGRIGVIAGIGVHPKHRRKKVALTIAASIGEWFEERGDLLKLQCEVYERNHTSQAFISSLGFEVVGEMHLN